MKLLIVDDEELTRTGLIQSIDWKFLGIDSIYEADDGLHGLWLAKKYSPEIILSDVRMPRLDGVEMAKQIREIMPECSIIFMSGYSDKAYLKAAIRLKAISYVEKPINPEEIKESVIDAIASHKSLIINKESIHHTRNETMFKLALKVIYPSHTHNVDYNESFNQLELSLKNYSSFVTIIIKGIHWNIAFSTLELDNLLRQLSPLLAHQKLDYIYGVKQEEYFVLHVFSTNKIPLNTLIKLMERFSVMISSTCTHFITIGKSVSSIYKLYESYNNAIILMHSSFFYPYNEVLYNDTEVTSYSAVIPPELLPSFSNALIKRKPETIHQILNQLKKLLINNKSILVNQVKDLYYKLFLELNESANNFHVSISADSTETILDYISKSSTFYELHSILEEKINRFFDSFEEANRDNSTIFLIKEYVSQNYHNENLSIKDISEHVFLSSSYVCTVFKTETGKTLNQYLTEYRMEKAKKLLMDSRYKITDISVKVGYSDGNYFGKTFKKSVGLSPSEFREHYLAGKI